MTYASAGIGSATHWGGRAISSQAPASRRRHVPFRGGPEGLTEVMTRAALISCVSGVSSGLPFVKDGKLLALAVSSTNRSIRIARCADVHWQAGFARFRSTLWNGSRFPPIRRAISSIRLAC